MKFQTILVLIVMTVQVNSASETALPSQLMQLVGKWKTQRGTLTIYEEWKKISDSKLEGKSWSEKNGASTESETLILEAESDGVYYKPTVADQNDGQQVRFKLSSSTNNTYIFSNPAHDFPQNISYTFRSANSVLAAVYGQVKGKEKRIEFGYARVSK